MRPDFCADCVEERWDLVSVRFSDAPDKVVWLCGGCRRKYREEGGAAQSGRLYRGYRCLRCGQQWHHRRLGRHTGRHRKYCPSCSKSAHMELKNKVNHEIADGRPRVRCPAWVRCKICLTLAASPIPEEGAAS